MYVRVFVGGGRGILAGGTDFLLLIHHIPNRIPNSGLHKAWQSRIGYLQSRLQTRRQSGPKVVDHGLNTSEEVVDVGPDDGGISVRIVWLLAVHV